MRHSIAKTLGGVPSLLALAIWLVTLGFIILAYRYGPVAQAMPLLVGWVLLVLVSLDLLSRTRTRFGNVLLRALNPAGLEVAKPEEAAKQIRAEIGSICFVALFVATLTLLGVLIAVPIFVFASVWKRAHRSLLTSILTASGATLFIWVMFAVVLQLPLFEGLLFGGDW